MHCQPWASHWTFLCRKQIPPGCLSWQSWVDQPASMLRQLFWEHLCREPCNHPYTWMCRCPGRLQTFPVWVCGQQGSSLLTQPLWEAPVCCEVLDCAMKYILVEIVIGFLSLYYLLCVTSLLQVDQKAPWKYYISYCKSITFSCQEKVKLPLERNNCLEILDSD